ncbi:DNA-binding GntR family transcriptional regulator [Prauserella shujinwangii]|uniref:DNA-binding GntR family transcriptional regulator n=1 Tax=Prauserella shujinwangii TaxID=1453103 RepID=A0A2T0LSL4_9PSEU|nr:GntR family transcriptional regulator [Prauserella shujinwangii]PRX46612.1 DNA-binding GntR family transcriptional regulator [Prauserella shujinwangii]
MSLTDTVHDQLKAQILRVERSPGDVLYEGDLAAEFGVSKTPVREALRLLAHDGWVLVLPRKGYLVRPVELSDVRDIFGIRRLFEPTLAAQAARSATPAQLDELDALVTEQADAGTDLERALNAARRFHLALAGIGGSSRTRRILENLIDEVRRLHFLLPNVEDHITSAEELDAHRRLVEALRGRDADKVRELMHHHLDEVATALVKGFAGI